MNGSKGYTYLYLHFSLIISGKGAKKQRILMYFLNVQLVLLYFSHQFIGVIHHLQ